MKESLIFLSVLKGALTWMNPNMWDSKEISKLLQVFANSISLHSAGLREEGKIFDIEISLKLF